VNDSHVVRNYYGEHVYAGGEADCTVQANLLNREFNCDTFTVEPRW
jgi:hypothetical protein